VSDDDLTVAAQRVHVDEDPAAPPTPFRKGLYWFASLLLVGLAKLLFRIRVEGRHHLPTGEPFILAPVHRSNLDFGLVVSCVGVGLPRMRYLAKDTLWKGAWGRLWTALGAIPVHRGTPDREALSACIAVLRAGESLVIFPEGTRQSGPDVQELFDGPAYVQARTGAPIVPVGIGGSEAAMPKGAKFVRPRQVVLTIGAPLPAPEKNDKGRVPRRAVREQTEVLHGILQDLFDDAQRAAGQRSAG
jgi:1-acyl-sn-glycerol-3-phosphate acyltransferase